MISKAAEIGYRPLDFSDTEILLQSTLDTVDRINAKLDRLNKRIAESRGECK